MPYGGMSCCLTTFLSLFLVFVMYFALREVIADRLSENPNSELIDMQG